MADGKLSREVLELEAIRLRREDREEALLNLVLRLSIMKNCNATIQLTWED